MRWVLGALALAWAACSGAHAQQPVYFPADNYGQPNKSFAETSVNQAQLEVLMSRADVFESLFDLDTEDGYRQLGRAVGMLDLLVQLPDGSSANTTCTATLIAPNRVLTNYHCTPGMGFTVKQAQLRLGYLDRLQAPGEVFPVRLPALEANHALDFAILEVSGVNTQKYPPFGLTFSAARDRQSLYLIHHPMGLPQRLTRIRCQAATPALRENDFIHHCDTLGGSSGSLVLSQGASQFVALHKAGVPDPVRPFNLATPAPALEAASPELRRLFVRPPQIAQPPRAATQRPAPQSENPTPVVPAGARVALIVANANYANYPPIANAEVDAVLVRDALARAGFAVTVASDLGVAAFRDALARFQSRAANADVALVYYAGQGLEASGRNWLVPIDARLDSEQALPFQALDAALVVQAAEGARTKIIVLDACRDNPFARSIRRDLPRRASSGLAETAPSRGTLLMFSAAPGELAYDGEPGAGSPFARAFARYISEPGVELRVAAGKIQDAVYQQTEARQTPFTSSSLSGQEIYFVPATVTR